MGSSAHGVSTRVLDAEESLEKIRRLLADDSGGNLLQGPLLLRPEALKKWNERWVILDPMMGRMEYKVRRNEPTSKGYIVINSNSTIAMSPVRFRGLPNYDGCCFYIGTSSKRDYSFAAETPGAARAWVSTLQAMQLVLRAQQEAVNSLSGNRSGRLGTVAAAVALANSTAWECSKEIEASMQITMRNALGAITNRVVDGPMDDFTVMKETLHVKDEELQNLAREIRARDSTIRDLSNKLSAVAEAADAANMIDDEINLASAEIDRLSLNYEKHLESLELKRKELEEKIVALNTENDQLIEQRDPSLQDAELWRSELAIAVEHNTILEAALSRAEEKARAVEAEDETVKVELQQSNSVTGTDASQLEIDPEEVFC